MLSTIGRSAVRRVAGGATLSTNRALQIIFQRQRVNSNEHPENPLSGSQPSFALHRAYATAATDSKKPTKTASARATKTKAKTAVKANAKPKVKKTAKKALKKKPVKKVVAKKKPVKKAKKVPTEEEKAKAQVKELKLKALVPPKKKSPAAWSVFLGEYVKGTSGVGSTSKLADVTREASIAFKGLNAEQLQVQHLICFLW